MVINFFLKKIFKGLTLRDRSKVSGVVNKDNKLLIRTTNIFEVIVMAAIP